MKDEIYKMITEAKAKGPSTLQQAVTLIWGADGAAVFRLGEIEGWRRARRALWASMSLVFMLGFVVAELMQRLT